MKRGVHLGAIGLVIVLVILGGSVDRITGTVAWAQGRSQPATLIPHGQDRAPNAPRSPSEAIRAMIPLGRKTLTGTFNFSWASRSSTSLAHLVVE